MKKIRILDREFALSIPSERIQNAIKDVADKLNNDFKDKTPLFICVLNGAFMFASDLIKLTNFDSQISFVKFASYEGDSSTGTVKQLIGFNEEIEGKDIVIIEDIVDTGLTLNNVVAQLKEFRPASVKIATLLFKPDACKTDIKLDYIGIEIPNDFIVGYGLDYDGLGRNLEDIYSVC